MTSIYDLLTGIQIDALKQSQLDTAGSRTYIDEESKEFWAGIATLAHIRTAVRTYAHGLPIPEESAVATVALGDGASQDLQPTGTEVWLLQNLHADSCEFFLTDGTSETQISAGELNFPPLYLTNTCYLKIRNGAGSEKNPSWAYHKVGL